MCGLGKAGRNRMDGWWMARSETNHMFKIMNPDVRPWRLDSILQVSLMVLEAPGNLHGNANQFPAKGNIGSYPLSRSLSWVYLEEFGVGKTRENLTGQRQEELSFCSAPGMDQGLCVMGRVGAPKVLRVLEERE